MVTSTVTLLFTDIVDSTRLWEREPDVMRGAVARHDEILRRAVEAHDGRVIVDTGDGIYAGFPSALGAVDAVIEAQRALLAEPWPTAAPLRVRMALHTGETAQADGDPKGPAANRTARLMALASGGQILLSQATADLVQDALPDGVTLRDLGEHALRSLARPERVCQLVAPGLLDDFSPLSSPAVRPNNLPAALTPFIGRERQMREVAELLREARLLTLTGPGGTGKSRLALEIAANRLDDYPDGAWLVELAPLADPALLVSAIGGALHVTEQPDRSMDAALTDYLRHKRLLLVLDNCEHMIDACARQADEMLHAAPGLTLLTTSREALGVAGETAYRVPSLGLPEAGTPDLDALRRSEAVQLFVARAQAVQPSFVLTQENAPIIADICRRLDGIPLAIELAAARTRALSVADIAARLDDRFRLLTGGSRAALPRQQTLRALVDWSWDLLSGPERKLLRRLSVFAGGCTLEDAEAVCADPPNEEEAPDVLAALDVLDVLASLVEKSLAIAETEASGATRYRLLETMRQYARDRLLESGEAAQLRDRHAARFLAVAEETAPRLRGAEMIAGRRRLEIELDNIRAALEWDLDRNPEDGLRLASALEYCWVFVGRIMREGRGWLERYLQRVEPLGDDVDAAGCERIANRARALAALSQLQESLGDFEASVRLGQEAAALARRAGDEATLASALSTICDAAVFLGDYERAKQWGNEAIALGRDGRYPFYLAFALAALLHCSIVGEPDEEAARGYIEALERLSKTFETPYIRAHSRFLRGMFEARFGDPEAGVRYVREGHRLHKEMDSDLMARMTLSELAHLLRRWDDRAGARELYRETIREWQNVGSLAAVAHQLESFASLDAAEGKAERAVRLLGAAEALREASGVSMLPPERVEYDQMVAALRAALPADAFAAAWASGRALDMNAAVDYALSE